MRRLRPSLTPMVDVVFLLLLFFLLSTQLAPKSAIALQATVGADDAARDIDLLEFGTALFWNAEPVSTEQLAFVFAADPTRPIAMRGDADANVQQVADLADLARRYGREAIVLVENTQ